MPHILSREKIECKEEERFISQCIGVSVVLATPLQHHFIIIVLNKQYLQFNRRKRNIFALCADVIAICQRFWWLFFFCHATDDSSIYSLDVWWQISDIGPKANKKGQMAANEKSQRQQISKHVSSWNENHKQSRFSSSFLFISKADT